MLQNYIKSTNINPHVSVDCVIFGFDFTGLKVLLIERKRENQKINIQKNMLLPGDLIRDDEDLDTAAQRVLRELTGLKNIYLTQFHSFGDPNRVSSKSDAEWLISVREQPTARVITVAYYALVKLHDYKPAASSFAKKTEWCDISAIPELAFDHNLIFTKALEHLQRTLREHPIGFELLPKKFTLSQLQKLYEAILQIPLDKRNFLRKILKTNILIPLKEKQQGVSHKRAQLYGFDKKNLSKVKHFGI